MFCYWQNDCRSYLRLLIVPYVLMFLFSIFMSVYYRSVFSTLSCKSYNADRDGGVELKLIFDIIKCNVTLSYIQKKWKCMYHVFQFHLAYIRSSDVSKKQHSSTVCVRGRLFVTASVTRSQSSATPSSSVLWREFLL